MNNTTNHVTNTLFSKRNEERVVNALLKLVDHITAKPLPKDQADWLANNNANHQQPVIQRPSSMSDDQYRIKVLENELAQANAKLSRRL